MHRRLGKKVRNPWFRNGLGALEPDIRPWFWSNNTTLCQQPQIRWRKLYKRCLSLPFSDRPYTGEIFLSCVHLLPVRWKWQGLTLLAGFNSPRVPLITRDSTHTNWYMKLNGAWTAHALWMVKGRIFVIMLQTGATHFFNHFAKFWNNGTY